MGLFHCFNYNNIQLLKSTQEPTQIEEKSKALSQESLMLSVKFL